MTGKQYTVRIIGGTHRGRRLNCSPQPALRPTKDSVRETVFNWLTPYLLGARCLDLFAGSGALGIEALSRGAAHVVFIEQQQAIAQQLARNAEHLFLPSDNWHIHQGDALVWLAQNMNSTKWHIVFCDPPFDWCSAQYQTLLVRVRDYITADSLVYIESDVSMAIEHSIWRIYKHKVMGSVQSTLLQLLA